MEQTEINNYEDLMKMIEQLTEKETETEEEYLKNINEDFFKIRDEYWNNNINRNEYDKRVRKLHRKHSDIRKREFERTIKEIQNIPVNRLNKTIREFNEKYKLIKPIKEMKLF